MTCWGSIAAVVVELFLADSETIQTFDRLLSASPHSPILVLSHLEDEDVAKLAVQRGAQDYLLQERLDGYVSLDFKGGCPKEAPSEGPTAP